ncbi:hypothetical protein OG455_28505 [Kitasatospora sp. NBC_01287]|uniref:prenyltransferase/squalene oxidase repeat-containing protein n=1 Tax=Kitasatospora sp. NBC_01287 TaxID=2903573 RepID=UPI00224EBBA1|nr:prenyltransferase/squalene oxidase repeat-containing protein [Kitasatospora sp. NBC_01287]MCX4749405.1 hypothetical protein [Kitasatospora sp. NBC_01287]
MLSPARTGTAVLSALLLAGLAAVPASADTPSASPSPVAPPAAVYGKGDPTYDGVWRQSLALTALSTAKVVPAAAAVDWLTGQQCANGGWPSFRLHADEGCTAATEDSNATAMAVQALVTLGGHLAAVDKGVGWLETNQNADGSWSYNPGGQGDADSTGLALAALRSAGTDPTTVAKAGRTGLDALGALQLDCAAPADQRGAFSYQAASAGQPASANALATAQAALSAAGGSLPVAAGTPTGPAPTPPACPATTAGVSADGASSYLATALAANGGHLMLTTPGAAPSPDFGATSWAVLSLVRAGHPQQAAPAADWLNANAGPWTKGAAGTDPAATATLILAAEAAGHDPHAFAGTDLVKQLTEAGPAPQSVASTAGKPAKKKSGLATLWVVGVGLLAGIGGGLFLSMNRKRSL